MWLFYFLVACVFVFLSQLSGLPQAMFYHLHWGVALPMAFMGFLILIPGLVKEIMTHVIWPFFRPFVQLLVEAVGFVIMTSDNDYSDSQVPSAKTSLDSTSSSPSLLNTILTTLNLQTSSQQKKSQQQQQQQSSLRNSPRNSPVGRSTTRHLSPADSSHSSPRPSPRQSPRPASRLATLRSSSSSSHHHGRSAGNTPTNLLTPNMSPYHSPHRSPHRTPSRSPYHSRRNSPNPLNRWIGASIGSDIGANDEDDRTFSRSPPESEVARRAAEELDAEVIRWNVAKNNCSDSDSGSDEADFYRKSRKIQKRRRKKLEEQYEVAIRTLTPVIRKHLSKKYRSESPDATRSATIKKKLKPDSETKSKTNSQSELDVT